MLDGEGGAIVQTEAPRMLEPEGEDTGVRWAHVTTQVVGGAPMKKVSESALVRVHVNRMQWK